MRRAALVIGVASTALMAACGDSTSSTATTSPEAGSSEPAVIEASITDEGCSPKSLSAASGPTTFQITNEGSGAVTEFEVLDGEKVLGEIENLIPGGEGSFSITLEPGSFTTYCPGGTTVERGTLEVAGSAEQANAQDGKARQQAVDAYLEFAKAQADELVTRTEAFAAAVVAGEVEKAKSLFANTREPYEKIEPIAESFGDLDPAIDAREGDVPDAEWGGFHRIEKALWVDGTTEGMAPVAQKLLADVKDLRTQIDQVELEPAQIANGAVELLNEVSATKITGEEDRYSHTDLSDVNANVAGSRAAFDAVRPLLTDEDVELGNTIDARFNDVNALLDKYRTTEGYGNGFVLYTTLTPEDTRQLSMAVDALAEPLSRVAAIVIVA